MSADDSLPDDIATLKAMLVAERAARIEAEAKAPLQWRSNSSPFPDNGVAQFQAARSWNYLVWCWTRFASW